ncbi:MAG: helix-turn-helix domain-containing protein [Patescibacteria group bacterium]|nr:helix-turn-helix domain-containing protein [Patescibacteria group bacterium]
MTATDKVESELLSKRQAAQLLGIGVRTVERFVARGVLIPVRPAGIRAVRFKRGDLLAWVEKGCPEPARKK